MKNMTLLLCSNCGFGFQNQYHLDNHVKDDCEIFYYCNICGCKYEKKILLDKHLKYQHKLFDNFNL